MKLEKVLALSLPISFSSPSLPLQLNCISPSLILIPSCPFPVLPPAPVWPHTLGAAAPQTIRCGDPVCGSPGSFYARAWRTPRGQSDFQTGIGNILGNNDASPWRCYFLYTKAESSNIRCYSHALMVMAACCLQVSLQQKGLIYSPRDTVLLVPDECKKKRKEKKKDAGG